MSKIERKQVGCWNISLCKYSRFTKQEAFVIKWVLEHAAEYTQLQLDLLHSAISSVANAYAVSNNVKQTCYARKSVGASYMYSGAVDHYKLAIGQVSRGWSMIISEPIGTDINRHKLAQEVKCPQCNKNPHAETHGCTYGKEAGICNCCIECSDKCAHDI